MAILGPEQRCVRSQPQMQHSSCIPGNFYFILTLQSLVLADQIPLLPSFFWGSALVWRLSVLQMCGSVGGDRTLEKWRVEGSLGFWGNCPQGVQCASHRAWSSPQRWRP